MTPGTSVSSRLKEYNKLPSNSTSRISKDSSERNPSSQRVHLLDSLTYDHIQYETETESHSVRGKKSRMKLKEILPKNSK